MKVKDIVGTMPIVKDQYYFEGMEECSVVMKEHGIERYYFEWENKCHVLNLNEYNKKWHVWETWGQPLKRMIEEYTANGTHTLIIEGLEF